MKLDFSKFKHLKSDDKTTTLRHPAGHTVTLAHNALAPNHLKALQALAPISKQAATPLEKDQMKHEGLAKGGEVKKDFGKVKKLDRGPKEFDSYTQNEKPAKQDKLEKSDYEKNFTENVKKYAEGTPDKPVSNDASDQSQPSQDPTKGITINIGGQPIGTPQNGYTTQNPSMVLPQQPQQPQAPQQAPQASPAPQQTPAAQPEQPEQPEEQEQPEQQAPAAAPQPQAAQPSVNVPNVQAPPKEPQTFHEHKDKAAADLMAENQAWEHDMANGHITPKTYSNLFGDKGTTGKLTAIFGLLLSGAGSGLAHQSNAMLDAMNKTIDNDLRAQQNSKENAVNFYKLHQQDELNKAEIAYKGKLGTLTQAQARAANAEADIKAFTATKMKLNSAALHDLATKIATLPPGPQRQQAEQTLAMMYQSVQTENFNLADKAAAASAYFRMLGLTGGGEPSGDKEVAFQQKVQGMKALGPQGMEFAKDAEVHHLPGYEQRTSIPVAEDDRKSMEHLSSLQKSYQDAQDYLKKVGTLPSVSAGTRAQGKALGNRLELEIGQLEGLGRFTPEEAKRYKGMIPDLSGTHFTTADISKLQGMQREIEQHRSSILERNGLKQPAQEAPAETKTIGGKQYKKVQGGWQRVP